MTLRVAVIIGLLVLTSACGSRRVAGYLEDQGVPGRIARNTAEALHSGNALLAIDCPSGKLGESEVSDLLRKFQADPCSRSQTPRKPVFTI